MERQKDRENDQETERTELIEWIIRKLQNASWRNLKLIYHFVWGLLS